MHLEARANNPDEANPVAMKANAAAFKIKTDEDAAKAKALEQKARVAETKAEEFLAKVEASSTNMVTAQNPTHMTTVKQILRWLAVLPGAFAAMIFVNIINGFTVAVIFPQVVDDACKSLFGSLAFVLAAYYIAPKGKFVTAVVVATAYCAVGTFAILVALRSGDTKYSGWTMIIMAVISIIASVVACLFAKSFEDNAQKESLEQTKRS